MSNANDFTIEDGMLKAYNGSDSCMVIPDTVTTIGYNVLKNSTHVDTVVIHPRVTCIQNCAFNGGWKYGEYPEYFNVHITDLAAFCRISVPYDPCFMPSSKWRIILNGEILEELIIPEGVTEVGALFMKCTDLKKLVIPQGVTEIAAEAFSGCTNLEHITLSASLKNIGKDAFQNCGLKHVEIAEGAAFKIGRIFGYNFPEGLVPELDSLSQLMDAEGVKNYIIPYNWKHLSDASRARIFLDCQDAKMKKAYKKLLGPADVDSLSEALFNRLGTSVSKKECETLAQFALDYTALLSSHSLNSIYNAIAKQKSGTAALKKLDADAGLKKKITAAASEPEAAENQTLRTKNDIAFENTGFDNSGAKVYDLGSKKVRAVLQPDLSVLITDGETGKVSKSIPKRGTDPKLYAAAAADYKAVVKAVKALSLTCRDLLYALYLSAEELTVNNWKQEWTGNMISRRLAGAVVWQQGDSFFTLDEEHIVGSDGKAFTLTKDSIRIAHTMDMEADTVAQWQKFFITCKRKQPFLQIWEPFRCREDIRDDRYKGCAIRSVYLLNKKMLGINASWYNQVWSDGDIFKHRYLEIEGFNIRASGNDDGDELEISCIEPLAWNRQTNAVISYLDRITVYGRIFNNDTSVTEILDQFTLEQLTDFIRVATENSCTAITAVLLDYKATHFKDCDPMEEFILEL